MAERRMFAKSIIGSANFLKMPVSSQALYFHLGCQADDDGVVEAYIVLKQCSFTENDLNVLVAKGFIVVLNDDLVSHIRDWKIHNHIRPDRKSDSIYKDLLLQRIPDETLIEPRRRTDLKIPDNQWTSTGQPVDGIGKDRVGKDRLDEDRLNEDSVEAKKRFAPPTIDEVKAYCIERNNNVNAEKWLSYYTMNGWTVGKGKPMKDWKAAVRYWEEGDKDKVKGRFDGLLNYNGGGGNESGRDIESISVTWGLLDDI